MTSNQHFPLSIVRKRGEIIVATAGALRGSQPTAPLSPRGGKREPPGSVALHSSKGASVLHLGTTPYRRFVESVRGDAAGSAFVGILGRVMEEAVRDVLLRSPLFQKVITVGGQGRYDHVYSIIIISRDTFVIYNSVVSDSEDLTRLT
jgi:hypothetical protein